MTANLLTLNSSKTEFLLTGFKQQPAMIGPTKLPSQHARILLVASREFGELAR